MTVDPLKRGFTQPAFKTYCEQSVAPHIGTWRPRGVVLHNTFLPTLATAEGYLSSGKWTFPQLIDNWWQRYIKLGWSSGPHLFIMPDKIWVATPLSVRGTHSPSFNSAYWGIELVGDYSTETLPQALRDNAIHAIACLFGMLGHEPSTQTLQYHGEDPRTTHKNCPGKNVGPKEKWIAEVEQRIADLYSGGDMAHHF